MPYLNVSAIPRAREILAGHGSSKPSDLLPGSRFAPYIGMYAANFSAPVRLGALAAVQEGKHGTDPSPGADVRRTLWTLESLGGLVEAYEPTLAVPASTAGSLRGAAIVLSSTLGVAAGIPAGEVFQAGPGVLCITGSRVPFEYLLACLLVYREDICRRFPSGIAAADLRDFLLPLPPAGTTKALGKEALDLLLYRKASFDESGLAFV